jgi:hypothetical protein
MTLEEWKALGADNTGPDRPVTDAPIRRHRSPDVTTRGESLSLIDKYLPYVEPDR